MRKHPILQMVIVIVVLSAIGIAIALVDPVVPGDGIPPGQQHPHSL